MKRRLLSLLLVLVMVLGLLPAIAVAAPAESSGVYQIGTAEELLWFAETVNGGETGISAVLTADIDLTGTQWPGIGTATNKFAGSFDGQGYTVTFNDADWGLFGYAMGSEGALITIQNVITAGSVNRSAIAHEAGYVQFTNCINRATITASTTRVGGILGKVDGTNRYSLIHSDVRITNCANEASITGLSYTGGILGWTQSKTLITGCYNTGNIHGSDSIGGLVGYFQGTTGEATINYCYNTGRVTGSTCVGGIVGEMENDNTVKNTYNAGSAYYAIAGSRFNQTAKVINCYYLGTASTKCSPDYNETLRYDETTTEIQTRATAVSGAEMATAEFAALLGDSFQQSCPTPVLSWQNTNAHTGAVCENCKLGSTEKEVYDVTFQQHDGYTLTGTDKATQGESYSFTLTISEGYEAAAGFAVKVNGETVNAASDGKYTVLNVKGPISVTVLNVSVIPGSHAISLPVEGYGYRVAGEKTVKRDADYSFTLSFVEGFQAGEDFKVIAQQILPQSELDKGTVPSEITLTGTNGTYTIPTVQKDYRILVSGVEAVSSGITATVNFTITEGEKAFHVAPNSEEILMDKTFTVPYFDLSLYGLERYYYNPYCYVDEYGNLRGIQQKGTPESAYDNITIMHALIVATELYYFEYDQAQVGTGASYKKDPVAFEKAISWTQDAGSSFMDFWDHGTNLNYYLNYEYPLGAPSWGSTSDQILIEDGDVLSVHMITGNASGSRFGFFVANDTDGKYTSADVADAAEVDQGEKIKLTLYWTATTANYTTGYERIADQGLYWIEAGNESDDVRTWNATELGEIPPEVDPEEEEVNPVPVMCTNNKGELTISTVGLEPGVYYIAALGGWTKGGAVDNAGFTSAGGETGPAVFKLTVNEYEGKLGDVNNDGLISADDATLIMRYVAKQILEVNESVADVNGDGIISADDSTLIMRYIAKLIDAFPAVETN